MSAPILEARDLEAFYGPVQALHGLDFEVDDGGVTALLGANGAGKTTTLRALAASSAARARSVSAAARSARSRPEDVARLGVAHVPDGRGTLHRSHGRGEPPPRRLCPVATGKACARISIASSAYFPRLAERRRQQAGTLSGGEQQMLAIARALLMRPSLLHARRAVVRARAARGGGDLSCARRDQPPGGRQPADRRAERLSRARSRRPRGSDRDRPRRR